jgi:GDP-L-fucose synthase
MKIIVLGGHGFLGTNMVEVFKHDFTDVIPLSRRDGLDLRNYDITVEYFKNIQPDIIINSSANVGSLNYVTQEAAEVIDDNIRMLLNIFKAANKVVPNSILITPVANCSYPGNIEEYEESQFWNGKVHQSVTAYGNSRRIAITLSECYLMQYGYKSINLLVPNMYGPYDSTDPNKAHALNAIVSKIVKAKKELKEDVEIWGSGIAIREWLYVEDCAKIFNFIIKNRSYTGLSEPINVAQNKGYSIRELVDIIVNESGYNGQITWNKNMPDGAPRKVMNDIRFRNTFPDYKFIEMSQAIKKTIDYYNSIYPY